MKNRWARFVRGRVRMANKRRTSFMDVPIPDNLIQSFPILHRTVEFIVCFIKDWKQAPSEETVQVIVLICKNSKLD